MSDGAVRLIVFEFKDAGTLGVYPRCPKCQRFIKEGEVFVNKFDETAVFKGWICGRDGEVKPDYEWVDPADLVEA